jgi:serine/threonine-protein kinase
MTSVPKTGTVVAGRYRVTRLAWPTAIGPVWLAKDLVLDRDVLLHSLAPDLAEHGHAREAFVACAAKSAQIGGAHLAQVYDCGDDPPYLVTELPVGGRLAERLADGRLSLQETARVVVGLAAAVRALHEHGTSHGAVGPVWIGLDVEGRPRLMGAGLADVAAIASAVRERSHEPPLVPPGYPSAADGDAVVADERGVAAVALHALTGRAPGEPGKPASSRTGIPQAVAIAIERALVGDATADDLARAFAPYATPGVPVEREPGFLRTEGKWLFAVLAFIVLGVAAVVVALALGKIRPSAPGSSPTANAGASGSPLTVGAVHDFDPLGNDSEHPEQVKRATDGDPTTAWFTFSYATADFGREKKGLGLVFDLGSETTVARILVRTPLDGWQAEWRVADRDSSRPDDFRVVDSFTAQANTPITLKQPAKARYWVLWITRLTDAGSGGPLPFQAAVAEVQFFAGRAS